MDTFEIRNDKAVYNGIVYDFDKLPENVVFDGDIKLSWKNLLILPNMSSWTIEGIFSCSGNNLTSLSGCPKNIGNWFNCSYNYLTSLKYCPEVIGGNFDCSNNKIASLKHCPKNVGGDFYCLYNKIKIIDELPEYIEKWFYWIHNPIKYIKEGIVPLKYLIEFYKENIGNAKELLMKELGCDAVEELNVYLLMMGEI